MRLGIRLAMIKNGLAFLLAFAVLPLLALDTAEKENRVGTIVSALTDSLTLDHPVLLDIRCGDWTNLLDMEMRRQLIARKADVRETNILLARDNSALLPTATETDMGVNGKILLNMLGLERGDILELHLEQTSEVTEKRSFISYARYNTPVYRFVLKQISLPEQKLIALKDYKLSGTPEPDNAGSILSLKWYEPVIASALIGSLIYMLWTFE